MTTSNLAGWLRAELAADREAIKSRSPTDWLVTIADTALPLAIWARAFFGALNWAIYHQEEIHDDDSPEPTLNLSMVGPALEHPRWSVSDSLQVGLLCLWLPVFFWHTFWGGGPLWAEIIAGTQGVALVVEPARVGVRYLYDEVAG